MLQAIQLYNKVGWDEYIQILDKDIGYNHTDMKTTIIIEVGLTSSTIISMKCYKTVRDK